MSQTDRAHAVHPEIESHQFLFMYKYVNQKGSVAIPAIKRSATEESIARRPGSIRVRDSYLLKTQGRHHQKSQIGVNGTGVLQKIKKNAFR